MSVRPQRAQRLVAAVLVSSIAFAMVPSARAQSASDKAAAESLFDEGKKLMASKKYAEACPKFEQSQKLDPGVGTLGSLGQCYEALGRTASAWATYREAAAAAAAQGQTGREKYARDKAAALQPKLSRMTILVPSTSDVPGLDVRRDGEQIPRAVWGTPLPVDPGLHTIEAYAPGKKKWTTGVEVGAVSAQANVAIPALEDDAAATPPPPPVKPAVPLSGKVDDWYEPTPATTTPSSTSTTTSTTTLSDTPSNGGSQRMVGVVVGGVGVVSILVGSYFGLRAKSKNADASTHCRPDDPSKCTDEGVTLGSDAKSAATLSTVFFVVGGAAIASGVVLYLTAPKDKSTANLGVGVGMAGSSVRLSLGGEF